jgi:hypothetical protein
MVVLSSCAGVAFAAGLATYGVSMAALPPVLVAQIFGAACCFTLVLDGVHWQILQRLRIDAD